MRIGIDVDDVVLDLLGEWCWRIRKEYGAVDCHPEELQKWEFYEDFGVSREDAFALLTPDIYPDVDAFVGAADTLDEIEAMGHEVVFVTSCPSPEMYNAKVDRLLELGLAKNRQIVPVGGWAEYTNKADVPVNWLVDDHIGNVEGFPGHAMLLTRPHNARLQSSRKRIKKLGDVVTELEYAKAPEKPYPDAQEAAMIYALTNSKPFEPDITVAAVSSLPTDRQERKNIPIMSGCLDYFSAALAEVAKVSLAGNKQHFVNEPLHWQRGLSADHADAAVRHLMERGTLDTDGIRHSAKAAWRALAELQEELERAGAPMSRASRPAA